MNCLLLFYDIFGLNWALLPSYLLESLSKPKPVWAPFLRTFLKWDMVCLVCILLGCSKLINLTLFKCKYIPDWSGQLIFINGDFIIIWQRFLLTQNKTLYSISEWDPLNVLPGRGHLGFNSKQCLHWPPNFEIIVESFSGRFILFVI